MYAVDRESRHFPRVRDGPIGPWISRTICVSWSVERAGLYLSRDLSLSLIVLALRTIGEELGVFASDNHGDFPPDAPVSEVIGKV